MISFSFRFLNFIEYTYFALCGYSAAVYNSDHCWLARVCYYAFYFFFLFFLPAFSSICLGDDIQMCFYVLFLFFSIRFRYHLFFYVLVFLLFLSVVMDRASYVRLSHNISRLCSRVCKVTGTVWAMVPKFNSSFTGYPTSITLQPLLRLLLGVLILLCWICR